jgi:acetyltransferase (GNAT) family protein
MGARSSGDILMRYNWEPLSHLLNTGLPALGARSWEEIGHDHDLFDFDVNWADYQAMETANVLRFMAVRDDDEILVGYASVVIVRHLVDRKITTAYIQDIYLEPEHRKGFKAFKEFIDILLDNFEVMKVDHASIGERENDPRGGIGSVYRRLGFSSHERIWTINIHKRKRA